jgi:hypothetical protein
MSTFKVKVACMKKKKDKKKIQTKDRIHWIAG